MPFSPVCARAGYRLAAWSALAVGLWAGASGCETARPGHSTEPRDPIARSETIGRGTDPGLGAVAAAAAPGKHATRRGHYVFYHDFEFGKAEPLLVELDALPDEVFGELALPPTTGVIQVFLFDTQERYDRYMRAHYRQLPPRRAYMIAEPRPGGGDDVKVFTWMGDSLRTDLRHELTHALLHSVLREVPLWLDEGLAGFFELPPSANGVNGQHMEQIARGPFQPDLGRLERMTEVAEMQKPEYREAWAWVHMMLRGSPVAKQVLREYMQALRTAPKPGTLAARLREVVSDPEQALFDHLTRVPVPGVAARGQLRD